MKKNLQSQELLKTFQEELQKDFPDLTYEQLREIVYSPWSFLKEEMENGNLIPVRFKYFGVFQVYPGRAKGILEGMKKRFEQQKIEPELFFKYKEMIEKFLDDGEHT